MGLIRKTASITTLGLIDFRSDRERTARYTKQTRNAARAQLKQQQQRQQQQPVAATPAAQWTADPTGRHEQRYFDGIAWTSFVSDRGVISNESEG